MGTDIEQQWSGHNYMSVINILFIKIGNLTRIGFLHLPKLLSLST
jgi:hypothetical protein